jgi:hypothetical protein
MAKSSGRGDSGTSTLIWAVAAGIMVILFVVWLSRTAEPSNPPQIGATDEGGAVAAVLPAEFEPAIATYIGREIELQNVAVVEHTGSSIVWVELPSGSPYLVKVSDAVAANGLPAAASRVTVVGTVREKTPAVLDGWLSGGVLNPDQRTQAEYGTTYIDATAIRAGS